MYISLLQYNPVWEDKEKNKDAIERLLDEQYEQTDLLILPEMTLTGFSMRADDIAETSDGKSVAYFQNIAKSRNTTVAAGYVEKADGAYYNTLAVFASDGTQLGRYRKIHPFGYAEEDKYYRAGEKPILIDIGGVKTGLAVCYDLRFPELFRFYGKEGAELILVIANWPRQRIAHWRALLRARAIENQCFVAAVNRVGKDPKALYNGYSSVFHPMGEEIFSLAGETALAHIEIDIDDARKTQQKFPFLPDIRLI